MFCMTTSLFDVFYFNTIFWCYIQRVCSFKHFWGKGYYNNCVYCKIGKKKEKKLINESFIILKVFVVI